MAAVDDLFSALVIGRAVLRRKWPSLLAFAGLAGIFHNLVAASFPAIGGMEAVNSVVGTLPDGLRQLLKLAPNLQAGFGLADYLAFTWLHPVFLGLGAAFVVGRAADGLAGEVERGSIYHLLSRPLSRRALVLGKAGEMVLGCGLICLAGWLGLLLGSRSLAVDLPLDRYLVVALLAWPLFAALGSGALVISSLTSRAALAGGLGAAWTLLAFVLDVIPATANSVMGRLNPWHGYFPQEIVGGQPVEPATVGILLGWLAAGTVLAMLIYGRRDLV